jgi:hypothetical protein
MRTPHRLRPFARTRHGSYINKIRNDFIQIPRQLIFYCATEATSNPKELGFCTVIVNKTGVLNRYVSQTFIDGKLQLLAPTRHESLLHSLGDEGYKE